MHADAIMEIKCPNQGQGSGASLSTTPRQTKSRLSLWQSRTAKPSPMLDTDWKSAPTALPTCRDTWNSLSSSDSEEYESTQDSFECISSPEREAKKRRCGTVRRTLPTRTPMWNMESLLSPSKGEEPIWSQFNKPSSMEFPRKKSPMISLGHGYQHVNPFPRTALLRTNEKQEASTFPLSGEPQELAKPALSLNMNPTSLSLPMTHSNGLMDMTENPLSYSTTTAEEVTTPFYSGFSTDIRFNSPSRGGLYHSSLPGSISLPTAIPVLGRRITFQPSLGGFMQPRELWSPLISPTKTKLQEFGSE